MTMSYPAKEDCTIERGEHVVRVMDCDGNEVLCGPLAWTDDMLLSVLAIARHAYGEGEAVGKLAKAREIRAALGLAPMEAELDRIARELAGLDRTVQRMLDEVI